LNPTQFQAERKKAASLETAAVLILVCSGESDALTDRCRQRIEQCVRHGWSVWALEVRGILRNTAN